MSQIATDMRETKEAARRQRFEPSGNLTSTDVQKAIEQVYTLSQSVPAPVPTPVAAASYTALATDRIIEVNYAGNCNITLGPTSARAGLDLQIKDVSGGLNAGPYTITITPDASDVNGIDKMATLVITNDYEAFLIRPVLSALAWRVGP